MTHLKSLSISICAATLMFGIIKNVLPGDRYKKYMRSILILIFVILSINGIHKAVFDQNIKLDNIKIEVSNVSTEEQVGELIKEYFNKQLKSSIYNGECTDVKVVKQNERYYIEEISVSATSDEAITILKEIAGLQEEQIRVVD